MSPGPQVRNTSEFLDSAPKGSMQISPNGRPGGGGATLRRGDVPVFGILYRSGPRRRVKQAMDHEGTLVGSEVDAAALGDQAANEIEVLPAQVVRDGCLRFPTRCTPHEFPTHVPALHRQGLGQLEENFAPAGVEAGRIMRDRSKGILPARLQRSRVPVDRGSRMEPAERS